ncbi:SDR family oxidoreductase [Nocardia sp. NPDC050710]|uniref:SDR family NAD(P)-dependent oxidoreductase n=1 Tax=Nocardia sp. NPDC050710 TaxID=3157220 RepID=UPI0033C3BF74
MSRVDYRNQTTLLTGASAGIGAEFARALAARGSDLVLVARRAQRLENLAAELEAAHGIKVTAVPADLSSRGAGTAVAQQVRDLDITVTSLVNCAGFGTFGPFHTEQPQRLADEIAVDVSAVVDLTRAFIGDLRAAGTGFLINVASMAAYQPTPNMAVYGAAKAFVLSFTEALWQESLGTGLRVLALSPGATDTEFFDVVGTTDAAGSMRLQSAREVVDTALRALDRRNPPPSAVVGRVNKIALLAQRLASRRRTILTLAAMTKSNPERDRLDKVR